MAIIKEVGKQTVNWYKKSAQGNKPERMVSGPAIDRMINIIHQMLGRGAPTRLDETGGSGVSYPIFQMFRGIVPGSEIPESMVVSGMRALNIHRNTQLPEIGVDYNELRQEVMQDYNRGKIQQQPQQSQVQEKDINYIEYAGIAEKKYGTLAFIIHNLQRYLDIKTAIREEMKRRFQAGEQKYRPRFDRFKRREEFPDWMIFQKSKEHIDGFIVNKEFVPIVEPLLKAKGYDTSEMQPFLTPEAQTKEVIAILQGRSITIDFGDYPGPQIINFIKTTGFRGSKGEKGNWLWTITSPSEDSVGQIEMVIKWLEERKYDCSELKKVLEEYRTLPEEEKLEEVEEPEGMEETIQISVRDVTGETNNRWHMAVKFLKKEAYGAATLKDILKYSFPSWTDSLSSLNGSRSINKEPGSWETYLAGNLQEYMNFMGSLTNRGFDSNIVQKILYSLIERGIVKSMEGVGVLDGFQSKEHFMNILDQYKLPFELYPEQKEGIAKMYAHRSFLKGDETGGGKTISAVLAADLRLRRSGKRTIIITRHTVQDQFMEAIANFLQLDINDKSQISDSIVDKAKWTVLTYPNFSAPSKRDVITNELIKQSKMEEIECLILDESHSVKNKSNRTTNIQKFSNLVPFVWGLSATVVANKPIDVWNQLKAINHPLGKMSYGTFGINFGAMRKGRYGLEDGPIEEQIEAVNKLKEYMFDQNVYDALSKKQLNKEMPDQIVEEEKVSVNQVALWARVKDRLSNYKDPGLTVSQMQAFRNEIAIEKVTSTVKSTIPVLDQGRKIMVFTDFKDSLSGLINKIQQHLTQTGGGKVTSIYGGMSKQKRKEAISSFKDVNSDTKAIIVNIIAGGTGLDFPNITTDVFVNDYDWSVANDEQALGRSYRINSEQDVNVKYTIAADTPDEDFYKRLADKKKIADIIHKMSMEQDALLKEGHRRARSKQLQALEIKLNEYKKKYVQMESQDKTFDIGIMNKVRENIKKASTMTTWYKKAQFTSENTQNIDIPIITIQPFEPLVQEAVDELQEEDPSFFKGINKINLDVSYSQFGSVKSDNPADININFNNIKSTVSSQLGGAFDYNNPYHKEVLKDAIKRTIIHEKGHVEDASKTHFERPEEGLAGEQLFPGGESAAEQYTQRHFE